MLSGPQRKFCEGIVSGLNGTDAYAAAYPKASRDAARSGAPVLLAKPSIQRAVTALRARAAELAGGAVLTLAEKRIRLARYVRGQPKDAKRDNEDCELMMTKAGPRYVFPSKLAAIKLDNDLAGEGSEAGADNALTELLTRIRK